MTVVVLGAGFTGLTAALRLAQMGQEVIVMDKGTAVGGLAGGFREKSWQWTLEQTYHHFFTNDNFVLGLAKELGQRYLIKRPLTDILAHGKIYRFDSPSSLLTFPHLSLIDRIRMGAVIFYLRTSSSPSQFEGKKALPWLRKVMGRSTVSLIWEPLFTSKFGSYKEEISLSWFWARIYKRTPSLAYPEGGFQTLANRIAQEIKKLRGQILLKSECSSLECTGKFVNVKTGRSTIKAQKVLVTIPSSIFIEIAKGLPQQYSRKLLSIPHLHALNLILIQSQPFLKDSYWLNITERNFPFLVLAEHTNFMSPKHYNNQHILYIGNYLPANHPYLKMTAGELLKVFDPYLKKIHPNYQLSTINYQLFNAPFAQPIMTVDYPWKIPSFITPLRNVYLANMDMVYPWDRGTNYAVEMGEKVAELVSRD